MTKEIDSNQLITLLCTISMSMMMSVADQMPPHKALASRVTRLEDAIKGLASLHVGKLSEEQMAAGVAGWNAAIIKIQEVLSGQETTINAS